jgi:nicotinamide-nucleotide amidase
MDFRNIVSALDFSSGTEYRFEPFEGDGDVHSLIELILSVMRRAHFTLSFAETSTGGALSNLVVSHKGASNVFKGSIVAYSLEAHEKILGIPAAYIDNYGIESPEMAQAAAQSVIDKFSTTHAISISGFASHWDGVHTSDVGGMWFAFQTPKRVHLQRVDFSLLRGQKNLIREKTCYAAMKILLQLLFEESEVTQYSRIAADRER